MKEDMKKIKKDNDLSDFSISQKDNSVCHTLHQSKTAIEVLFGDNYILWPPNTQLLAL